MGEVEGYGHPGILVTERNFHCGLFKHTSIKVVVISEAYCAAGSVLYHIYSNNDASRHAC